jgi:hypothetical protein
LAYRLIRERRGGCEGLLIKIFDRRGLWTLLIKRFDRRGLGNVLMQRAGKKVDERFG